MNPWRLRFVGMLLCLVMVGCSPPPAATLPPIEHPINVRGTITYGETVTGTVLESENHWYFEGIQGEVVTIVVAAFDTTPQASPGVALLNPHGETVAASRTSTTPAFLLPEGGRYTIVIGGKPGNYRLSLLLERTANAPTDTPPPLPTSPPAGRPIRIGEIREGALSGSDPIQIWALEAQAGDTVTLRMESAVPDMIPALRVFSPDLTLLAGDDSAARALYSGRRFAQIVITFTQTGTFILQAAGGGHEGSYLLSVMPGLPAINLTEPPPTVRPTLALTSTPIPVPTQLVMAEGGDLIRFGETLRGAISSLEEADRYALFVPAGQVISVGVFGELNSPLLPSLELLAPDGSTVASVSGGVNPTEAVLSGITLPTTGVYVIFVRAAPGSAPGTYLITSGESWTLREVGGGEGRIGTSYIGELLRAGDRATWRFELPVNAVLSFEVTPQTPTLNPVLEIIAPDGTQVVALRGGEGGTISPPYLTTQQAGVYQVRVTSFKNESIGIFVLRSALISVTPTPTFEPVDYAVRVSLLQGERHQYRFKGIPGDVVVIEVRALPPENPNLPIFDPIIVLYAPNGARIARADDLNAANTDALLQTTLDQGIGEYRVEVFGYALMPGTFTVQVRVE